jgi:hypothetical protein
MTRRNYPLYGLIGVVGAALAIWAGMPPAYLFILACPLMMMFMMGGMNSGSQNTPDSKTDASGPKASEADKAAPEIGPTSTPRP